MKREKEVWCWKATVAFETGEVDIVRQPAADEAEFRKAVKNLFVIEHALISLEKEFKLYDLYK